MADYKPGDVNKTLDEETKDRRVEAPEEGVQKDGTENPPSSEEGSKRATTPESGVQGEDVENPGDGPDGSGNQNPGVGGYAVAAGAAGHGPLK